MPCPAAATASLRRFAILIASLVVALMALAPAGPARAASDSAIAAVVGSGPIGVGVDTSAGFWNLAGIDDFERTTGRHADIVQAFVGWGYNPGEASWSEFSAARINNVLARGSTPEISWDPTVTGDPVDQPGMNLASIADGAHDAYITRFAQGAKSVGKPILIRFAHEMNGSWNSYSEAHSGNRPGDFVRAWRHVHAVFASVGATNVQWIWAPNVVEAGTPSLAPLYPGDDVVDWVALDGYSYPKVNCRSADAVFSPALNDIRSFTSRPVMLAEVAVSAACPNKATWIGDLFRYLAKRPYIKSLTWWNRVQDNDWRIESSTDSVGAFCTGLVNYAQARGLAPAAPAETAPVVVPAPVTPVSAPSVASPGAPAPTPVATLASPARGAPVTAKPSIGTAKADPTSGYKTALPTARGVTCTASRVSLSVDRGVTTTVRAGSRRLSVRRSGTRVTFDLTAYRGKTVTVTVQLRPKRGKVRSRTLTYRVCAA